MTEVVDGFSQFSPRFFVAAIFGHDKVRLTQHYPFRVDANKISVTVSMSSSGASSIMPICFLTYRRAGRSLVDQILIHLGIFRQVISCHY